MSVKMMTAVFERFPYGGNERVLALALADNANEYGEHIYPGNKMLAKKCLMSERTVVRMLQKFIEIGWLVKVSQGNKRLKQANEYRISVKWVMGGDLDLLSDKLSPNHLDNQVTNEDLLSDKIAPDQVTNTHLLGDTAMSPQRHIQHHNNVITTPREETPIAQIKPLTPSQILTGRLCKQNVQATGFNPYLLEWIAEKISDELIDNCVQLARLEKPYPEKIPMRYLNTIIRREQAKALRPKKPDSTWMMSDAGIDAKARELGVVCPPNIQNYRDFAKWLQQIMHERQAKAA